MKKVTTLILVILTVVCCAVTFTACIGKGGGTISTVKFLDSIENAEAVQNDVCDLSDYVSKVSGYDYYVEAYQIDAANDFAEIPLVCDGLTFIPVINDDAFVVLCAKKGDQIIKSDEVIITVVLPRDDIVEAFVTSWCDPQFTLSVNTDAKYIKESNPASIKVEFFGSEPSEADRWQYFATPIVDLFSFYSVTDWTDAVVDFWVYNPTDYELEFSPIWSHTGAQFYANRDPRTFQTAAPKSWTNIKYSLRYFNMTEEFFFDVDVYESYITEQVAYGFGTAENGKPEINQNWWTVRWDGRKEVNKVYGYSFYISGFDIRNYDEERDSDLDNTLNGAKADYLFGTNDSPYKLPSKVRTKDTITFEVWAPNRGASSVVVLTSDWKSQVGPFTFDVSDPSRNSLGVSVSTISAVNCTYNVTLDLRLGGGSVGKDVQLDSLYWHGGYSDTFFKNLKVVQGDEIPVDENHPNAFILWGDGANVFGADKSVSCNDLIKFNYKLGDPSVTTGKIGFMLFDGTDWENYLPVDLNLNNGFASSPIDGFVVSNTELVGHGGWYEVVLDLSKLSIHTNEGKVAPDTAVWRLRTIYSNARYTDCTVWVDGFAKENA